MRRQHQFHLAINLGTASQRLNWIEFELAAIEFAYDSHESSTLSCHLFRRLFRRVRSREGEFYFAVRINVD